MKRIIKSLPIVVILSLLVNLFGGVRSVQADVLSDLMDAHVSLSAEKVSFSSVESVVVQVKISNPNQEAMQILKWQTPAEGVQAPLFLVTLDGEPVQYLGAVYKRMAPTDSDYITINAGESLEYEVSLSDYYDFSESGNYEVYYNTSSAEMYRNNGDAKTTGAMKSATLVLEVEGRAAPRNSNPLFSVSGPTSYFSCNAGQQSALSTARTNASTYANESLSYFNAGKASDRFVKWFGILDITRWNLVRSHYTNIVSYIDTASINFDCTCTAPSTYAYVYPSDASTIYLCGAFWFAPATGTDSKAGTLIHEASHFYVNGGTDDYVYGQSGAMNLASSTPNNAVMNADNHEYFSENTPATVDGEIFGDVPDSYWAWSNIEILYNTGVTGGCSTLPLLYCPTNTVTRAEMAVFLEKGLHGNSFVPPNVSPTFSDTAGHWAEDWIEALKADQITTGCGTGLYCPNSPVTRAQMAVFLLKAKYGYDYSPLNVSPTFGDTVGHWAEDWIEKLALDGITTGCGGGNYCPDSATTRDQMAVFLVNVFSLP